MFVAHFEAGDAEKLALLVRNFSLPGFRLNDIVFDEPRRENAANVSLVDDYTYQKLLGQRDSGKRENIYVATSISVYEHKLFVYSGYGSGCCGSGTLVTALAQSTEVTLTKWEVWSAGYGSGSDRIYAEGTSSHALLKYLHGDWPAD
jgi:hypothetical protein